ncbi:MAG TPA: terminase small subunit [Sphaerochaeta sp.]|nr:terminase small subunit [Sphaerochaeta sp.]
MSNLTDYEKRFVAHFMLHGDKVQALKDAGYVGKGKKNTMTAYANRMYNKPRVLAEINKRRERLEDKSIVTAEEVITTLTRIMKGQGKYSAKKSNGEVYEVGIKAKDQIEAAKALANIMGLAAPKKSEVSHTVKIEEQLVQTFLERSDKILGKNLRKEKALALDVEEEDDADIESIG